MHTVISLSESVLTLLRKAELPLISANMRDLEKEFVSSRNVGNTYQWETFFEERGLPYCYAWSIREGVAHHVSQFCSPPDLLQMIKQWRTTAITGQNRSK